MFDPVPHYENYYEEEEAAEKLKLFQERVDQFARRYHVNLQRSRFLGIFSVCTNLSKLIKEKGDTIWKSSEKEPIEDFQILFQLLIYLLGDRGLLFDLYGRWNVTPDIDFWPESEQAYSELLWAMLCRHYASIQLEKLRRDLRSRANNLEVYEDSPKDNIPLPLSDIELSQLHKNYLKGTDCDELKNALHILSKDPLCRQAAPLFLFLFFQEKEATNYARKFYSLLKREKRRFPEPTSPKQILKSCENWEFYCQCDEFLRQYEIQRDKKLGQNLRSFFNRNSLRYPDVYVFAPYTLLNRICVQGYVTLTAEQIIQIANYSLSLESGKEATPPEEICEIQIKGIPIIEIMEAFSTIWKAPLTQLCDGKSDQIIKKGLKKSLCKIYNSGILGPIEGISGTGQEDISAADYCDNQYNEILEKIENTFGDVRYSFSQEAFWLIAEFEPPYNYIPKRNSRDLYSCCFRDLHKMWHQYNQLLTYGSPRYVEVDLEVNRCIEQNECAVFGTQMGIGAELHTDILKARLHLASQWNENIEMKFLNALPSGYIVESYSRKDFYHYLLDTVEEIYDDVATAKTSYKSLTYAPDILYANLVNECFLLTERHLYEEVFKVISSINRILWPR